MQYCRANVGAAVVVAPKLDMRLSQPSGLRIKLAGWVGNIAMVVIGVGYLSYFFPALKDPMIMTLTCVLVLWFFEIGRAHV